MENILNNLIRIDDECKNVLNELKEKQENIEYLINNELIKQKNEIKTKYKFKIDMRKNEYDIKFTEQMKQIEDRKNKEIEDLERRYSEDKPKMIQTIVDSILEI